MKKKRMLALLMLLLLLSVPAYAESFGKDESIRSGDSRLPYFVSDTSGLMTTDQWQKLENTAKEISEQYQCGVYVVTLDDYRSYGSYNSFWDFSEDFYVVLIHLLCLLWNKKAAPQNAVLIKSTNFIGFYLYEPTIALTFAVLSM